MRLMSWNVNGLRAVVKKGFTDQIDGLAPDVLGLQETKAQDDQVREALFGWDSYQVFSSSAVKKGYSGTAVLTKHDPSMSKPELVWRRWTKKAVCCGSNLRRSTS